LIIYVGDQAINWDLRRLQADQAGPRPRACLARRVLADVLQSAVTSDLDLRDAGWHAGSKLAQPEPVHRVVVSVSLLEVDRSPRQHQQRVKQMPIMAETITTSGGRLLVLSLDRQIEIVGYVLDDLVSSARWDRCTSGSDGSEV
jgi:hypothetical protein